MNSYDHQRQFNIRIKKNELGKAKRGKLSKKIPVTKFV